MKKLSQVFKGLVLTGELETLFEEAIVEHICMDTQMHKLLIDLKLFFIVHPKQVEVLEEQIASFVGDDQLLVQINESFQIENNLTKEQLYQCYQPCLTYLLSKESPFCSAKLNEVVPIIEENHITYELSDFDYKYMSQYTIGQQIEEIFKKKFHQMYEVILKRKDTHRTTFEAFVESRKKEEHHLMNKMALNIKSEKRKQVQVSKSTNKKTPPEQLVIGRSGIGGFVTKLKELDGNQEQIIIEVYILSYEMRTTKSGKALVILQVTDDTDSITCKAFLKMDMYEEQVKETLKTHKFVRIEGRVQYDTYSKELGLMINKMEKMESFRTAKEDQAKKKRIELLAHTQMSDMDGVISPKVLVKYAKALGHSAIAITDHGVVQGFPEAFHALNQGDTFKIIYGVEAYLVDDLKDIVRHPHGQNLKSEYVVFDLETTGFYPGKDKITEIGAVKIKEGKIVDRYGSLINPERSIPVKVQELTGITMPMVKDAPIIEEELDNFLVFCGDSILVAHNADFDLGFIEHSARKQNKFIDNTTLDTLELARIFFPDLKNNRLSTVAKYFNVSLVNAHRAVDDAEATAYILLKMFKHMNQINIHTIEGILNYAQKKGQDAKKLRASNATILVKNLVGLRNLYELISKAHMTYFFRNPKTPKSVFNQLREGLLIGSGCSEGELYKAILGDKPREEINRLCEFYDYFEIQPVENNAYLIEKGVVDTLDELRDINKRIVALGETHNKLVVATGDVHILTPEDQIYRKILMHGKKFVGAEHDGPLYFRTTEEMLEAFAYLGEEKAYEVVVTNTHKIGDEIEKIDPVPAERFPPIIEGSDKDLKEACYKKAHSIYGPNLPEVVEERLERELHSIISHGFAVLYVIAQKLVKKSMDDGYLVGSRGSVGSSFVATMADITEVNPLRAHYICEKCYYTDFDSDRVKAHVGNSGCDLPDAKCPECGHSLSKEGHDIPFETFLGFSGDKEPDIDLNFSGEYQGKAHKYTEELFGKGYIYRAGTIGTLAEKTAYGYVKNYYDDRNEEKRGAEIQRLVQGCTGVRRTSGQHPGGIIVLPKTESIYKFTPIQHPANDQTTEIITTHFDYHSIDHNLLKLDILGHDDPTMIRMLEDLTGVRATEIPLDEPKVMSLFVGLTALNIEPEDIGGTQLGSLGLPEFGTDFVIKMLLDTKPQSFSDLCRISGLSHGTDVWLNNAESYIKEGVATIQEIISTRDDIMTYLISKGVEKKLAFTIMESVRKGKGLQLEMEGAMEVAKIPTWYVDSCKKIKYMFPKAHAVAYVMMAYRIAYFKVYYKEAYYATYFSVRATDFNYETMCHGKHYLEERIKVLREKEKNAKNRKIDPETGTITKFTKKDKDTIKDMKIVQEMYARGIEFEPIDLYKVKAKAYQVIEGKIMPALSALPGLGEKAAEALVRERKKSKFISIEDMRERTKMSKTVIELMKRNNLLDNMQESNQISLF